MLETHVRVDDVATYAPPENLSLLTNTIHRVAPPTTI